MAIEWKLMTVFWYMQIAWVYCTMESVLLPIFTVCWFQCWVRFFSSFFREVYWNFCTSIHEWHYCFQYKRKKRTVHWLVWLYFVFSGCRENPILFIINQSNTFTWGCMALFVHTIHSHISSCHRNFSRCVFMRRSSARFAFRAQGDSIAFDYCWFHQHKTSRIQMLATFILYALLCPCHLSPFFFPFFLSLFRAIQCHLLSFNIFISPFQCIFIRFCTFRATKFNGNTFGI